jgi:ComF family protein
MKMLSVSMFNQISSISNSFSHLVFPQKCIHCENELIEKESFICFSCMSKITIHKTYALYNFEENTVVQSILHALKYKNNPKIGREFGKKIGEKLLQIKSFEDLDALIPVPMHPKKKFLRGYNQAEMLARGISEVTSIPIQSTEVKKLKHTQSQTQKSLWERWTNSENTFSSSLNSNSLHHIALVDDVLTTGATMERLATTILDKNPTLKISLITLAITK